MALGTSGQQKVAKYAVRASGTMAKNILTNQTIADSISNDADFDPANTGDVRVEILADATAAVTKYTAEKAEIEAVVIDGESYPYTALIG